jgi:hypothetical protein
MRETVGKPECPHLLGRRDAALLRTLWRTDQEEIPLDEAPRPMNDERSHASRSRGGAQARRRIGRRSVV